MTLDAVVVEARAIVKEFEFIESFKELDRTDNAVKFRLHIGRDFFIQVYVNLAKDKVNLAVISQGERIFGRDSEGGIWHKHPFEDPAEHDFSEEGSREVSLMEFVTEVEDILLRKGLL